jgi:two-component system, OmpR family, alkaline phosphatase synthesis response regulator PhoP
MPKILIVDDEQDIIDLLEYNLQKAGYQTQNATDGLQAVAIAKTFRPDLILLDVMMPYLNGIETAKKIREQPELAQTFILFLTSVTSEDTEIHAFKAGADDYIVKPIKPQALLSRISAFFRREKANETNETTEEIHIGNITINRKNHAVLVNNKPHALPKKEFELLYFFMQKPGKIFSREQLLQQIWGSDIYVVERTVDVHIRKIREKIGDQYIKTFKGIGYMFSLD